MLNTFVRHALALAAAASLALAGSARADGPYGGVVLVNEPPPIFTWTGFYIGGNIGGGWANGTLTDNNTGLSFSADHSGFIGGAQIGFNYQIRNLVLGVEWDFDWTSIGETRRGPFGGVVQASADTDWVTTLAGRVGLTFDRWLVFVKMGGGWVHNSASITDLKTGAVASRSNTNGGWLVGGGVEYAFTNNWTAKAEYNFLGLSDRTETGFGNSFTFERDMQMLKVGLNYKF